MNIDAPYIHSVREPSIPFIKSRSTRRPPAGRQWGGRVHQTEARRQFLPVIKLEKKKKKRNREKRQKVKQRPVEVEQLVFVGGA